MPIIVTCIICSKQEPVTPSRAKTYKTCSHECYAKHRSVVLRGENHWGYKAGNVRVKSCAYCGDEFRPAKTTAVSTFQKQRFCSKPCADKGGHRHRGDANWKWQGGVAKRSANQKRWAGSVITRDGAKCTKCGAVGVELHAHHVKPFKTHPALRWEVSNGITLCAPCHWREHSASDANAVNSGEPLTGQAEGNPEPSPSGNIREGATTRGRAYRRIELNCTWCGAFMSRRKSDVTSVNVFCSMACRGKHWAFTRTHKPARQRPSGYGSNAPTSAAPERDDIVWTHGKP